MTWTPPAIEFPGYELTPETITAINPRGPFWQDLHALGVLLHERDSRFTVQEWNTIVSAIKGRLPLIVTVRERFEHGDCTQERTLMVEYAIVSEGNQGNANRLRCYSWGFGGSYYYLGEIVKIDTPYLGEYVRVEE